MTTPSIQIASQSFTKRVSKAKLPYIDQAVGYYLLGGNAATSLHNLAYGASIDLSVIGAPTYGTGYGVISGTAGFDTGLLVDVPYTKIAVAKVITAGVSLGILTRGAGADANVGLLRLKDQATNTVDHFANDSFTHGISNLQTSSYRLFGARWGGSATHTSVFAYDTAGLLTNPSSTNFAKTITPTTKLRIGAGYTDTVGATANVAAVALYSFVMTDSQVREVYRYLKALLAARGITVV